MSTDHVRRRLIVVLVVAAGGVPRSNASTSGTQTVISTSGRCSGSDSQPFNTGGTVNGNPGSLSWSSQQSSTGGAVTVTTTTSFMGAVSNGVIVGTIAHASTVSGFTGMTTVSGGGNSSYSVTPR